MTVTEPNDNDPPKRGTGTWGPDSRWPDEKERAELMDADIVGLRRKGVPLEEIGRQMVVKYGRSARGANGTAHIDAEQPFSKQYIYNRWQAAIKAVPAKKVDELRAELNERLEGFLERVEEIMTRDHVMVSQGRVMMLEEGPLLDDGPVLAAIAEGRKLLTEIRQLNGATVPVDQNLNLGGSVNYTINGVQVDKLT